MTSFVDSGPLDVGQGKASAAAKGAHSQQRNPTKKYIYIYDNIQHNYCIKSGKSCIAFAVFFVKLVTSKDDF